MTSTMVRTLRRLVSRVFEALLAAKTGVTTLEFALVAPAFFFATFMIIDVGVELFAQAALDSAVIYAGRQIQIGAIRGPASSASVRTIVCNRLGVLAPDCSKIQIYATSGGNFTSLVQAKAVGGNLTPLTYDAGQNLSFVLLQVGLNRPLLMLPLSGQSAVPTLISSVAVRNEQ